MDRHILFGTMVWQPLSRTSLSAGMSWRCDFRSWVTCDFLSTVLWLLTTMDYFIGTGKMFCFFLLMTGKMRVLLNLWTMPNWERQEAHWRTRSKFKRVLTSQMTGLKRTDHNVIKDMWRLWCWEWHGDKSETWLAVIPCCKKLQGRKEILYIIYMKLMKSISIGKTLLNTSNLLYFPTAGGTGR